ncbi:FliA/WhiG family RNA polymerase sigma factor [Streptomyces sp. TLI_146]|nr:FliA/WhiG family RNA polymerase sigma factor [Streptomyces sp. TLI_146]
MTKQQQERSDSPQPAEDAPVPDMLRATETALAQTVSPAETEASLASLKERLRHEATTSETLADHAAVDAAVTSTAQTYVQQQTARTAVLGATALGVQSSTSLAVGGSGRPPASSTLDELWRAYKATADERLREQLILHYSPLVKYVAGRVSVGLPSHVEQADFVVSGIFGLIDAIEKYDVDREVRFETYAITRIRGAMLDELRALDRLPRSVRQKASSVEQAYATLEARLRRTPTEAEVAGELGIAVDELHKVFSQLSLANVAALEGLLYAGGRAARTANWGGSWRRPSIRCPSGRRLS